MKDDLGKRMKENYEQRTKTLLPRRTYTIIRMDGKAFHTYTRGLKKPFDEDLINDLDKAVVAILPQIQGAEFAYVQSDEISILLTDFSKNNTDAWFDGNIQKITSVSASLMTAEFNKLRWQTFISKKSMNLLGIENSTAYFDSRVFTIPDRTEVMNYFIWRNNDAARNSVSMVAQSLYPHNQLQNKNSLFLQEMIFQKGINWSTYDESLKNGRLIINETYTEILSGYSNFHKQDMDAEVERNRWIIKPAWKFTQNKEKLLEMIPVMN